MSIVLGEIGIDSALQVDNRAEDAATGALAGHFGKEALNRIQPAGRGWSEVEGPARMTRQPSQHSGMLVGGVIVERMDQLAGRHFALDGIEETDEFAVSMALHALADHPSIKHAERGEEGGGAVTLIVMCHGLAAPGVDR